MYTCMYVYMYVCIHVCMYKYTDINDFNKYREHISSDSDLSSVR